jgi:NAD-dependent SIR2 family protein deacetylase
MGSEDWDPYVEAKRISIEWAELYGKAKSAKCKICKLKINKSTCKLNDTKDKTIIVCEECEDEEYTDTDSEDS